MGGSGGRRKKITILRNRDSGNCEPTRNLPGARVSAILIPKSPATLHIWAPESESQASGSIIHFFCARPSGLGQPAGTADGGDPTPA